MKNKLTYIFILTLSMMLLSGCSDDDPEHNIYTNVELSEHSLSILATDIADILIKTPGEGYEVSSSDSTIAIAEIQSNIINILALKAGRALITLKGDGNKRAKIDVLVAALNELTLDKTTLDINLGALGEPGSGEAEIKTGNGDYSVQSSNPEIVTASISDDKVLVYGTAEGEATVTITDKKGKTAILSVNVIGPSYDLTVDVDPQIPIEIAKGDPAIVINIISGNEGYQVESSDVNIVTASLNNNQITLNSVKDGYGTVTLTDRKGRKIEFSIVVPFDLTDSTERIYWDGYRADTASDANVSGNFTWGTTKSYIWNKGGSDSKTIKVVHSGTIQNPTLPKLTDEDNQTIQLDALKVDKVDPSYTSGEPVVNSVFWVTFEKDGKKGFIVVKKK